MTALRKRLLVVAAMAVVGCLALRQAGGDTALQVRWTSALALNSIEEINQRLDLLYLTT